MSIRPGPRLVIALLAGGLTATACTPLALPLGDAPIGTPSPSSTLIGCERAAETVEITSDAHLDPACTYTGGVQISASNVVFDCRGAHITDVDGTHGRGVSVSADSDTSIDHVTVRNCIISGFLNNVRVSREGFKDLVPGSDYDAPFSDIVIENSRLFGSRGSGVFVNAYVTGVTLRNLEIAELRRSRDLSGGRIEGQRRRAQHHPQQRVRRRRPGERRSLRSRWRRPGARVADRT